ncbi:MAG: DUF2147 domain-containing protein [Cyclobacteriaceae bacterium]|nr:DUF2147 domain-containing protein [Cyclobacteriaceae bacterium]
MRCLLLCLLLLSISSVVRSQSSIVGKWMTIDDETNKPRSTVEIVERNGIYFGRVVSIMSNPGDDPDPLCDKCPPEDDRYKKKVIGMEILRDMKKSESEYSEGTILDPKNGKIYRCKIWIENNNLKLRGYWGPFFRTQTWLHGQ